MVSGVGFIDWARFKRGMLLVGSKHDYASMELSMDGFSRIHRLGAVQAWSVIGRKQT